MAQRLGIVLAVAVWLGCMAGAPAIAADVCNNGNLYAVQNKPPAPQTRCHFDKPVRIAKIVTYHWNDGHGVAHAGTILLRNAKTGVQYGPFRAVGSPTSGARLNLYWTVEPNLALPAGDYEFVDSDVATWSWNSASRTGIVMVSGEYTNTATATPPNNPPSTTAPPHTAATGRGANRLRGLKDMKPLCPKCVRGLF